MRFKGSIPIRHVGVDTNSRLPARIGLSVGGSRRAPFWRISDPLLIVRRTTPRPWPAARWSDLQEAVVEMRELVPQSQIGNRRLQVPWTVIGKCGQATKGAWWMPWH